MQPTSMYVATRGRVRRTLRALCVLHTLLALHTDTPHTS